MTEKKAECLPAQCRDKESVSLVPLPAATEARMMLRGVTSCQRGSHLCIFCTLAFFSATSGGEKPRSRQKVIVLCLFTKAMRHLFILRKGRLRGAMASTALALLAGLCGLVWAPAGQPQAHTAREGEQHTDRPWSCLVC